MLKRRLQRQSRHALRNTLLCELAHLAGSLAAHTSAKSTPISFSAAGLVTSSIQLAGFRCGSYLVQHQHQQQPISSRIVMRMSKKRFSTCARTHAHV